MAKRKRKTVGIIEHRIFVGLILSGEYLARIEPYWKDNQQAFENVKAANTISTLCWEHYHEYDEPIKETLDTIFTTLSAKGEITEDEENDFELIFKALQQTHEINGGAINVNVLVKDTLDFFNTKRLEVLQEVPFNNKENLKSALKKIQEFAPLSEDDDRDLDYTTKEDLPRRKESTENAFNSNKKYVFKFKGKLGELINNELYKGAFVSVFAREKMGKSYFLLECLLTAHSQGNNTLFFQAGDMTKDQQTERIGTRLAQIPNKPEYLGVQYDTILDCARNQTDNCTHPLRECRIGLVNGEPHVVRKEPFNKEQLIDFHKENPDYKPCTHCKEFQHSKWGVPFVEKKTYEELMTVKKANDVIRKKLYGSPNHFITSSYNAGELTVPMMRSVILKYRKKGINFDCIGIDYMDLLSALAKNNDHKQDIKGIWEGVRGMSQDKDYEPLVIAPTQADANSYKQRILNMSNFSDSKYKNATPTAILGLNQDPEGIENSLGIIRVNKILSRGNENDVNKCVSIIQNLKAGRPITRFTYW